jgi:manganese efflux pump family protein
LVVAGGGYRAEVVALFLVALSVGLDNFGAATSIGVRGVDRTLRLRVAVVFGVFEAVMPLIGILLGRTVAGTLGGAATPLAGALLAAVGLYSILVELLGERRPDAEPGRGLGRLVLIGALLSVDNLVIGFALGTFHVNVLVAAVVIAVVSVSLSLLGLELGSRLGTRLGERAELAGGLVLVAIGIAVALGVL